MAKIGFSNGKSKNIEVLETNLMLDEITSSIYILDKRLNLLKQSFNRLLNRSDSLEINATTLAVPTDFKIKKDPDSLLSNHPKLVALEQQMAAAIIDETVVRKNGFPQIGLGIDYMIIQPQDGSTIKNNGKDALMPMFSLSIPIYRKKYQSQTREVQVYQKQLAAQKKHLENTLAIEWATAQNKRFESQAQYDLDEQRIQNANQEINFGLRNLKNANINFKNILESQNNILKIKLCHVTWKRNYAEALAKITYLISKDL